MICTYGKYVEIMYIQFMYMFNTVYIYIIKIKNKLYSQTGP